MVLIQKPEEHMQTYAEELTVKMSHLQTLMKIIVCSPNLHIYLRKIKEADYEEKIIRKYCERSD